MGRARSKLVATSLVLSIGLLGAGCVGMNNALSTPIERKAVIYIAGLPSDTKPIKIALLSDIHVGNFVMTPQRLGNIVKTVNAAEPDMVVLAGDFVNGENEIGTSERALDLTPLAGLRAPQGVYAVLGNHDQWTDPAAIRKTLARAGVQVLDNAAVRLGPIALVGIGDRFSGHDDIAHSVAAAAAVGGIPVAFTHSPDLSPALPRQFQILLAGHTHCGQMVAPFFGPIVRYSRGRRLYNPRYRCGRVEDGDRSTIITSGVGSGTVPLRYGAMPDWWLIEVRPRAAESQTNF